MAPLTNPRPELALPDEDVIARVRGGDAALFEILMRRHNQRLYRAVRGILRNEAEVEDVMQQTYLAAYAHLDQFAERARFSTWLCRIGIHEALARRRRAHATEPLPPDEGPIAMTATTPDADPEDRAARRQLARLLEDAVDALPEIYRVVFMLRDVEELSTAEAAACLDVTEETVKVRLHRARNLLRESLYARAGASAAEAFTFGDRRCDRLVDTVLGKIGVQRN